MNPNQDTQSVPSDEEGLLALIRQVGEMAAAKTLKELSPPAPNPNEPQPEKKTLRQIYANAASALTLMPDEDLVRELEEEMPNALWVQRLRANLKSSAKPPTTDSSSPKTDSSDVP
jgi:hypothetical protein